NTDFADYIDAYARRYSADGSPLGDPFVVNSYTNYIQRAQGVAIDADGDFVITWQSDSSTDFYAQRFASNGTRQGDALRVNTSPTADQGDSRVAMDAAGDFAITWAGRNWVDNFPDVYAQRYHADGTP